ncbi:MAG: NAD-dependent deacylase [Rhodospirillales bacterium]
MADARETPKTPRPETPRAKTPRIVVLTGAGISKESGLSTFRDPDGIWASVRIEDVATPEAFARNPARVHDFYNQRRRLMRENTVQPNAAHLALARLETEWPEDVLVVTQNVDSLHEQAGSRNLIHMHGEHAKIRCMKCGHVCGWADDLSVETPCPACAAPGGLRPDVVWFGEQPMQMERIYGALSACGLFVSVGTSGAVYPAAGFAAFVRQNTAARTVELNLEPSAGAELFEDAFYGPATEAVPAYVEALLAG